MKFQSKEYYSEPVKEIAEEVPPDELDEQIKQSEAALAELQRQKEIEQQAANLATLQEAQKRQEAKREAEIILSQAVAMTKESSEASKAKIAAWQEKFKEFSKLYSELSSEYSEIQKSLLDSGLKLRNATLNAAQVEPTPDNGHVTGPQDGYIRLAQLMNKTGMTDAGLDIRPTELSQQENELFSLLADGRPLTRYLPSRSYQNFDFIRW